MEVDFHGLCKYDIPISVFSRSDWHSQDLVLKNFFTLLFISMIKFMLTIYTFGIRVPAGIL